MSRVFRLLIVAALLTSPLAALAAGRSTLTLDNQSGGDALVRLSGPTSGTVAVPNGSRRTLAVRGGEYHMYVRYERNGRYSYSRGEPFSVTETDREYEELEITLHTVIGGNYGTHPSDEAEFANGR